MNELTLALEAMDRLNSWVRSPSFSWQECSRIIYQLKTDALELAYRDRRIDRFRLLEVKVKCRDCGGSGRYYDQYGQEHNHCWACHNSGTATLRFIETRMTEPAIIWHTPTANMPGLGIQMPAVPETTDWTPNQKGKALSIDEAARDLVAVERTFGPIRRYRSIAYDEALRYRLYVGEVVARCGFCRVETPDPHRYHVSRKGISWSAAACEQCGDRSKWATASVLTDEGYKPNGPSIFDAFPAPSYLLTHNIRQWMKYHLIEMADLEPAWKAIA